MWSPMPRVEDWMWLADLTFLLSPSSVCGLFCADHCSLVAFLLPSCVPDTMRAPSVQRSHVMVMWQSAEDQRPAEDWYELSEMGNAEQEQVPWIRALCFLARYPIR